MLCNKATLQFCSLPLKRSPEQLQLFQLKDCKFFFEKKNEIGCDTDVDKESEAMQGDEQAGLASSQIIRLLDFSTFDRSDLRIRLGLSKTNLLRSPDDYIYRNVKPTVSQRVRNQDHISSSFCC